ncbi:MAG: choice-of-anchor D domain-containing protein [Solirubrobacterales bacterium]
MVRHLGASQGGPAVVHPAAPRTNPEPERTGEAGGSGRDPLAAAGRSAGRTPAPNATFEGQGNGCGCTPPDTTGDVGPNNYIQLVNSTGVAIHNKSGALVTPAFDLGDLWPAADTCAVGLGDPQVVYDSIADRWNLLQFDDVGNRLCWAVSRTGDPTGAYNLYDFTVPEFPDYFKVGVWPNGYYVGTNETNYTAYSFNRAKMLAGDPTANFVRFSSQTNFLMPADVDGPLQPTGGGLFYTFKDSTFHGGANDRIELFQLTPDFTTPANSTFTLVSPPGFTISPFTYTVCGFFVLNCIPQGGTTQKVDAVSEWPMQRFAYRQVGGHETLVGNFTVKSHTASLATAGAGIRWFELRNSGAGWSLFQEGTHDPNDGTDRFMGSTAIDSAGDIALGYSASSSTLNPAIRYATRGPGDAAGTLQAEQTMQAGGGSQTGSSRWGDYSSMTVDPVNGCTFWYTTEYYAANSPASWHTRVGNFDYPGCLTTQRFSANPTSVPFATTAVGSTSSPTTVTITNPGTTNLTISSVALTSGNTGDFSTQNDNCSGQVIAASGTCTIQVRFSPTAAGYRTTELRFTDDASGGPHDVPLAGTGVIPAPVFSATPTAINFGSQLVGTTSAFQTVTVTNTGTANLSISSVALATGNPGDFGTQNDTCTGATLAPAQTCTIQARFSPTAAGPRATNLRFTDNASGSPHDVSLLGTATTSPPPPPSNHFTIEGVTRNTSKGTATVRIDVPGPGNVALGGKGVQPQRSIANRAFGATAKPVAGAGPVDLLIKATGSKKRKLKKAGKVRVQVTITYAPTGGTPASQPLSVKLKRKRR